MSLSEKRETLAVAIQAVAGTAEELTSAHAQFNASDISYSPNIQQLSREARRNSLGTIPTIAGLERGTITFKTEMVGSGNHISTPPPWDAMIRGCGFQRKACHIVAIGNITSGPFIIGEVVNNGSGVTATVAKGTRSGTILLVTDVTGGSFSNSDTLTGAESSATTTASSANSAIGYVYSPRSSGFETVTPGVWMGDVATEDSLHVKLSDCLGNFTLQASNAGEFVGLEFEFQGALIEPAEAPFVEATEPDQIPPTFVDANVRMHDGYDACVNSVTLTPGNSIELLQCANSPTGVKEAIITGRDANGSVDPVGVLPSSGADAHDFINKWRTNATGEFEFVVGTVAGNQFIIQAPRTQYTDIDPTGARAGRRTFQTNLLCHDTKKDDQLVIFAI